MNPSSEVREFLTRRGAPGMTVLVYTAEPDTPTTQALGFLASWAESRPHEAGRRR